MNLQVKTCKTPRMRLALGWPNPHTTPGLQTPKGQSYGAACSFSSSGLITIRGWPPAAQRSRFRGGFVGFHRRLHVNREGFPYVGGEPFQVSRETRYLSDACDNARRESEPPLRQRRGRASRRHKRGSTTKPAPGAPARRRRQRRRERRATAIAPRERATDRRPTAMRSGRALPTTPQHAESASCRREGAAAERYAAASAAAQLQETRSASAAPQQRRRESDRNPSPLAIARLAVTLMHRGNGADAERERVVAAAAAAERDKKERAEKRAERAKFAPRARVRRRPASSQPTSSSRRCDRDPSRGNGADAERERVVAAVAAAERDKQERAEKRAERAKFAPRARVWRRPASSQPTSSDRRRDRDPNLLATASRPSPQTSNAQRQRR